MRRTIRYMPLAELEPAARNPRIHNEASISASITRFGYVESIVLDERTGRIVAGHGRREDLLRRLAAGEDPPEGVTVKDGAWLVPVQRGWSSRSDDEAESYLLASNRTAELASWEPRPLAEMLADLQTREVPLDGTGFTSAEIDRHLAALEPPEPPAEPRAEPLPGHTEYRCPSCRHEWSGSPRPRAKRQT